MTGDGATSAAGAVESAGADAPEPDDGGRTSDRPARAAGRSRRSQRAREAALAYVLVAPAFVVFAVFVFYPFLRNFELALYRQHRFIPERTTYVGWDQPREILTDGVIWSDLWSGLPGAAALALVGLVFFGLRRRAARAPGAAGYRVVLTVVAVVAGVAAGAVLLNQVRLVLVENYVYASLWTTLLFAVMTVPAGILLGLALAVAAHQRLRGIAIYRTIFASTITTSVAVAAVIFGVLFNPRVGWLPWLGFSPSPELLENPTWALPSVAFLTVWQNIGFAFIIMSAGLQAVPDEVLEAARMDGARAWRRFWRVTVPMLSPTIFFAVVVGTILAFQTFGQIHMLTKGGPGDNTNVMAYAIYDAMRGDSQDTSRAAVLSIVLFFVTLLITVIQVRVLEKRVHYA